MNTAVYQAALRAGCTRRQSDVIATWVEAETLEDTAEQLGISNRAVLQHLRAARRRLNVPHNGTLILAVANPVYLRSNTAAR